MQDTGQLTRGMRRRAAKMARRAEMVTLHTLIAGVDVAMAKSTVVFMRASDKAPLGQLTIPTSAEGLSKLVHHANRLKDSFRLSRLVVAMEPCADWRILARATLALDVPTVFVQSFALARSREIDDLTRDKNDFRDARLIADLAAERKFIDMQPPTGVWAELRPLAEARMDRQGERNAALQEQRAFLRLIWPGLLATVRDLDGSHVQAALRLGLTPMQIAAMPVLEFTERVRQEHKLRFIRSMARRIWEASQLATTCDELATATLRIRLAGQRVQAAEAAITEIDQTMLARFADTGLSQLGGQIRGLSDVLLLNLLALIGDPRQYDSARCLPKLAGSNPTERSSGQTQRPGGIHRRGRPSLRVLAYRAAVGLVMHNADFRARFQALTQRKQNKLCKKAAYMAIANKLLRTLWHMAVTDQAYDSAIACGERRPDVVAA